MSDTAGRRAPSLARAYLLVAGAGLLLQGGASLLVSATGRDPHLTTGLLSDPMHATIHVAWGVALLVVLMRGDQVAADRACLAFGIFYVGFLVLGLLVHHPFGMEIDWPENAFHTVVGPLALLIWAYDVPLRRRRSAAQHVEGAR